MSITLENIAFDCANAATLATFWAGVLSVEVDAEGNEFFATVNRAADGPTLMFLQVPEPRTVKNRLHLDLATADWDTELDRLLALGAQRLDEHNEYGTHWITLADPEGNVFDLAEHKA
ncbi:VOC family protein [Kribbella sp. NPDC056345]|uniref:VOC family protein n=1 Tax=Kribbella sp. NPDC056345 TaxID=3345789 RepID=UPI0035DB533E